MEDGDAKWIHHYICYGNHWHEEDTFGVPYPMPPTVWWNGDNNTATATGASLVNATYGLDPKPGYWSEVTAGPVVGVNHSSGYDFFVTGDNAYINVTQTGMVLPVSPVIELNYIAWGLGNYPLGMGAGWDMVVTVTDGALLHQNTPVHIPGYADTPVTVDISMFSGATVDISLVIPDTGLFDPLFLGGGWFNVPPFGWCDIYEPFYSLFEVWAYLPDTNVTPVERYYNNVDEKLIFEFDLMHAYEAILHFDHNFSFFDENDIGTVEIWTGSAWQPILVNKGAGDWGHVALDITAYIDHDANTMVRFRFESNETGNDAYGWLVDSISIDGKVDYTAPTASHSLSPGSPTGNNGWYTSDVTVTVSGEDNVQVGAIMYRIDGGSWLTYTSPFSIGIEGEHTVEYYPVDGVGNEGATGMVSFKIDKTNPTASITTPQAGYIYFMGNELMPRILVQDKSIIIGGLTAQATASDSTSGIFTVKFNEDGTTFAEDTASPFQAPLPFALFQEHTLTVTAVDMAGNSYTTGGVTYMKIF
jgi:hypothetical protein